MQVPTGGYVTFTATFDVQFGSDPKCTFVTLTCCSGSNGWRPNGYPYGDWGWSPPYMTRLSNTQVKAELEGHSTFEWRLRASGVPDRYVISGSVLTVDQWSYSGVYAGKTVRVSARVPGERDWNWSDPEVTLNVPSLPAPPPPPPPPPQECPPPQKAC